MSQSNTAGVGYTLATGRLFAPMDEFHPFCEELLDRPILTHEFGDSHVWAELREAFEARVRRAVAKDGWKVADQLVSRNSDSPGGGF